jgi:hypothetical protein
LLHGIRCLLLCARYIISQYASILAYFGVET